VTFPRQEGVLYLIIAPAGFFLAGLFYSGPLYGIICAAVMVPFLGALWALHRILKSWAKWPSRFWWTSYLKAAIRYLLTDS
jgi:hypothetical protein